MTIDDIFLQGDDSHDMGVVYNAIKQKTMEAQMRTYTFILIFGISTVLAQNAKHQKSLAQAETHYLIGLHHTNNGVILSTIQNIMLLKQLYPKKDYSQIIKKLDDLSLKSPNKLIRLNAFLASNYLKYSEFANWTKDHEYNHVIKIFNSFGKSTQNPNGIKQVLFRQAEQISTNR